MKPPEEKDRETARGVCREWYASHWDNQQVLERLITQALHTTRISALKEAAEVLKPFLNTYITKLKAYKSDRLEWAKTMPGHWAAGSWISGQDITVDELRRACTLHDEITKTLKELEGK